MNIWQRSQSTELQHLRKRVQIQSSYDVANQIIHLRRVSIHLSSIAMVEQYPYNISIRISLTLNNPRRLICHEKNQLIYIYIYIYIYIDIYICFFFLCVCVCVCVCVSCIEPGQNNIQLSWRPFTFYCIGQNCANKTLSTP